MKLKITVKGVEYEVDVEVLEEGNKPVIVPNVPAQVNTGASARAPKPVVRKEAGLVAPVSGTIIEIKCKEGQQLKHGDPALIIEAMKMQTALAVERDITVKKIHVKPGDAVREGNLLIEYA